MYRSSEMAYASMDFLGRGYITEQDLISHNAVKKLLCEFTETDIREMFINQSLFAPSNNHNQKHGGMIYDTFKKTFFPHLHQTFNLQDQIAEETAENDDKVVKLRTQKQPDYIRDQLKRLDHHLRNKVADNWTSVRKAFLSLDSDHDGMLDVEDFLKHFGQD